MLQHDIATSQLATTCYRLPRALHSSNGLNAVGPAIDFDQPAKVCVGKFPMFPVDSEVVHSGTPQQATIWGYSVISYRATQTKNKKQFLPVHLKCTLISHKSAMPIPEGVGSYG